MEGLQRKQTELAGDFEDFIARTKERVIQRSNLRENLFWEAHALEQEAQARLLKKFQTQAQQRARQKKRKNK